MSRWLMLLAVVLTCGLLAAPATATTWSGHDHHDFDFDDEECTITAAEYLPLAAQSNSFEIVTGQLAVERGESATVRAIGAVLVEDHTAVLAEITTVAGTLGVALPDALDPKLQALADRLATLSGEKFDRVWLKVQWRVHLKALALNLRTAVCGDVPEIRALAQAALPVLTSHLAAVRGVLADRDDDHNGHNGHGHHNGDDDCKHVRKHDNGRKHGHDHAHKRGHGKKHGHDHHHGKVCVDDDHDHDDDDDHHDA